MLRRVGVGEAGSGADGVELLPRPLRDGELGGEEAVELRLDCDDLPLVLLAEPFRD